MLGSFPMDLLEEFEKKKPLYLVAKVVFRIHNYIFQKNKKPNYDV
jgi:hypothetical protein